MDDTPPSATPPTLEQAVTERILLMLSQPGEATAQRLEATLRFLAKWRSMLIDRTVLAKDGPTIQAGPFAGMHFVSKASESSLSPKLLGSYEAELHGTIAEIAAGPLDLIVDIGCADGYYAVGFARLMPHVRVMAHDINPAAQRNCLDLASRNGVSARIGVAGQFRGEDFAALAGQRALVFIDIEGAEDDLLRPDLYPALRTLTVLVECHDVLKPGLSARMAERFAPSHDIRRIEPSVHCPALPDWFAPLSDLDKLLAGWEWRGGPTPWLFLKPRSA